ncbi:hypothetical protein A4X06_0g6964 [Tilletia controversa]|uniref:Uncharacterized protein n=1 Tax=Tilletia controversa TaxID=13291 RepID=A0A8X7MNP9_9BASI|nr:hypothetical protein CF328_g6010 [Tilletia controversa]KAE8242369.1 hypothetical protein A4X06_0g6964 [Tilletia controversa]
MPAISHLVHDLPTFTSAPHIPLVLDTRHLVDLSTVDKADARTIHPKSISDLVFVPYHARSDGIHPAPHTETSRSLTSQDGDGDGDGDGDTDPLSRRSIWDKFVKFYDKVWDSVTNDITEKIGYAERRRRSLQGLPRLNLPS